MRREIIETSSVLPSLAARTFVCVALEASNLTAAGELAETFLSWMSHGKIMGQVLTTNVYFKRLLELKLTLDAIFCKSRLLFSAGRICI